MNQGFDSGKLAVCGLHELLTVNPSRYSHVISIWHPSQNSPGLLDRVRKTFSTSKIHTALFDDIESDGPDAHPPRITDAAAILRFTQSLNSSDTLLIHCMAGISRSTACAIAILCQHDPDQAPTTLAKKLATIRPQADPNRLLIRHFDQLLNRGQQLIHAVEEVFGPSFGAANKGWIKSQDR